MVTSIENISDFTLSDKQQHTLEAKFKQKSIPLKNYKLIPKRKQSIQYIPLYGIMKFINECDCKEFISINEKCINNELFLSKEDYSSYNPKTVAEYIRYECHLPIISLEKNNGAKFDRFICDIAEIVADAPSIIDEYLDEDTLLEYKAISPWRDSSIDFYIKTLNYIDIVSNSNDKLILMTDKEEIEKQLSYLSDIKEIPSYDLLISAKHNKMYLD